MLLKVDSNARPFRERLELDISINEDLVLKAEAWSLNQGMRVEAEVHDLEFALATPGTRNGWVETGLLGEGPAGFPVSEAGDLAIRANLASTPDDSLVPGEVMHKHNRYYFHSTERRPPQVQVDEHLYYQPCSYCGRRSNDPLCKCATSESSRKQAV
jgi:hypothetical protein